MRKTATTLGFLSAAGLGAGIYFFRNRMPVESLNLSGRFSGANKAEDIMTEHLALCTRDTTLREVGRMMVDYDCGEIPVVDSHQNKRPIGVITDRDIVCRTIAQGINPLDVRAESVMSVPVKTVRLNTPLNECIRMMEEYRIRRLPVVDEQGRLCGIISQADLIRFAGGRKASRAIERVSEPQDRPSSIAA